MNDKRGTRVSLNPLTPEEALRALLAVDPSEEPPDDVTADSPAADGEPDDE